MQLHISAREQMDKLPYLPYISQEKLRAVQATICPFRKLPSEQSKTQRRIKRMQSD